MLVKEVVALAADTLGLEGIAEQAEGEAEPEGELKSLLRCYNLIENEVALDFFPLKAVEVFTPEEEKIPYTRFSSAPVNIYKATDGEGTPVRFTIMPSHLSVPGCSKPVRVTYAYSPEEKGLGDETAFSDNISARLLAFGVASEYCIANRRFSEGAMWGRRYRDALRAAGIYRRTLSVRSRRWI